MSHTHENCPQPWPYACNNGIATCICDYPDCDNEYCVSAGHCECKCHSGKTCECGNYSWPRMEKQVRNGG